MISLFLSTGELFDLGRTWRASSGTCSLEECRQDCPAAINVNVRPQHPSEALFCSNSTTSLLGPNLSYSRFDVVRYRPLHQYVYSGGGDTVVGVAAPDFYFRARQTPWID